MHIRTFTICLLLMISQSVYSYYRPYGPAMPKVKDPCSACPTPCPKASTEELENLSSEVTQRYKRNKDILHAQDSKEKLSLDDLQELKEASKKMGDFETFAEAYHRIKLEVATEDAGNTLVFRVKDLALPAVGITIVAAALGGACTHYFGFKK